MAPFNDHVDTFWHPVPKMAEIFFGDFLGSTMTKKPFKKFFFTSGGPLGPLFQKNLKTFILSYIIVIFVDPSPVLLF